MKDVLLVTPLTLDVSVTPFDDVATDTVLFETIDEVAVTPFTFTVKVFPEIDAVRELIIFAAPEVIPFTIVWNRLALDEATFELIIFAEEFTPFTFEVNVLTLDERVFVVDEAIAGERSKLDVTPLTLDVKFDPARDNVLFETTLVVAVTPLIVVVKVFPATL